MAESLNSPLLSVASLESSGAKIAKNTNSEANFGQSDDFSRVLDKQQGRSRKPDQPAEASYQTRNNGSSVDKSSGNGLPQEGNQAADVANLDEASTGQSADGSDAAGTDSDADSGAAAAQAGEGSAADESSLTDADGAALLRDLLPKNPVEAPKASNSSSGLVSDASSKLESSSLTLLSPAKGSSSLTSNVPSASDSSANETVTGKTSPDAQNLAALTVEGSKAIKASALSTQAGTAVPTAEVGISQSGLQSSDVSQLQKLPSGLDTAQTSGASAAEGQKLSSVQTDASALKATTADWLRANMDSQSANQRAVDVQLDGANELARTTASMPRGDAVAAAPAAASPVVGMAPSAAAASPSAAAAATMPEYSLARAPDDAEFPGELTARMKTLVRDGVREARLQLHPAELGRLQVTVTTEGDQTKVAFTAETSAARDAIEQSLPRLREMLEQSGLQLANADVGEQGLQGEAGQGQANAIADSEGTTELDESDSSLLVASTGNSSRIDTYI
ncbi:flagellar hook-length control protein FliK [Congregibacter brevis]|uniref:Flagellar hook-length control protein FliK n=1 Tax=Congregibacter brevis TaxID=3081201 RepID=A0ABZ0IBY1_9GAMM|nr:flagellar hook-length control protein FliK [Congregibacter sp. IMCC45268]